MDYRVDMVGRSPAEVDRILAEEVMRRGRGGIQEVAEELRSPIDTVRQRVARAVEADETGTLVLFGPVIDYTDELWTIGQVAEYLGYASEVSARQAMSRWGVQIVRRDPGRYGRRWYSAAQVRAAREERVRSRAGEGYRDRSRRAVVESMAGVEDEFLGLLADGVHPRVAAERVGVGFRQAHGRRVWDEGWGRRMDEALMRGRPEPGAAWHGTDDGYCNHGCRCPECRDAHKVYTRKG